MTTTTETAATTWRRWLPAAAAGVALLIAAAALLVASPGGMARFPRLLLRRQAPSRMALAVPAGYGSGGMRYMPGGPDPLAATALIRGVPTQRMTAPDLGFSQVRPRCAPGLRGADGGKHTQMLHR